MAMTLHAMTAWDRNRGQGPARRVGGAVTPVVTRFAPSPTGRLHLGHALSAVRAHDLARTGGGRFLLRIEDIDGTRSRAEHVDTILRDLEWLGLEWDALSFQSARLDLYAAAQGLLADVLYPCFCTRAEIAASLSAPHGPVAIYPGTCRYRPAAERAARMGEPHGWRIDMARAVGRVGPLKWVDHHAGEVRADPLSHGDVILARKDAPASYHLAATVDDAEQGVTDVVRGVDLFDATHVHRLLQAVLGLPVPRYHHHPLIVGADGQRLAKRHGAPALAAMREDGKDGRALADALRRNMLPAGFRLGEA